MVMELKESQGPHSRCPPLLLSSAQEAVVVLPASLPAAMLPLEPYSHLEEGAEEVVNVMNRCRWKLEEEAGEGGCER